MKAQQQQRIRVRACVYVCVCVCLYMKNAQLLIQMEIIYTLDTDLLDGNNNNTSSWQWQPLVHVHTYTQMQMQACVCVCVCVVYAGLLISFLLGYVLCEITQVQPTVIYAGVCFWPRPFPHCPFTCRTLLPFFVAAFLSVWHFLFELSYANCFVCHRLINLISHLFSMTFY